MATVTGFTAERMLIIENETVIDGEVRADNLILQRRDGIEIDAGNVRGPKGDQGTPGTNGTPGAPGVIQSVNDLAIPSLYSPRQFDDSSGITSWITAPIGSVAVDRQTQTIWQKDSQGWFIAHTVRSFLDTAQRDAYWLYPPDGAICQAPIGTEWRRIDGAWVQWGGDPNYAGKPLVTKAAGPGGTTDCANAWKNVVVPTVQVVAGRTYLVVVDWYGSTITAPGILQSKIVESAGNGGNTLWYWGNVAAGVWIIGSGSATFKATTTGPTNVGLQFTTTAGAIRFNANTCHLTVIDMGKGP